MTNCKADPVEKATHCWQCTRRDFSDFGLRYSGQARQERERLLDCCLERIEKELSRAPQSSGDAERTVSRLTGSAVELATCALDIRDSSIDSLLHENFSRVGIELARWALRMDPGVSMADVLQACRNAWTAGALQLLFGLEVRLTPAIFAYSMLYPYTDNYLDDAAVSILQKMQFGGRFRERLTGINLRPCSRREETVWDLVSLIEAQYPRDSYPEVYDSLLSIHGAQQDSIAQMQRHKEAGDLPVLKLSISKGGASVLADGYLAAGTLNETEATFAFNWGVLLQLSDDLQDLKEDCRDGSLTIFSRAAKSGEPLDELTSRTFHFGERVLRPVGDLAGGSGVMRQMLTASSRSLMMRSVACSAEYYTEGYLRELENYSPFSFQFLRTRERRMARRRKSLTRLFELFLSRKSECTAYADANMAWTGSK